MNLRTWTLREAHQQTGIPVKTLRKLIDDGTLAGNRTGKLYRVSVESLVAFVLHKHNVKPLTVTDDRQFPEVEDQFS